MDLRLPSAPFEAYFLRRYESLVDALKEYRADKPIEKLPPELRGVNAAALLGRVSTAELKGEFENSRRIQTHLIGLASRLEAEFRESGKLDEGLVRSIVSDGELGSPSSASGVFDGISLVCDWEKFALREGVVDQLIAALGPDGTDYEAAFGLLDSKTAAMLATRDQTELELRSLLRYPDPVRSLAAELELNVRGLMWAYASPERFFLEIAPRRHPGDFDVRFLGSEAHPVSRAVSLGATLWRWGFGALINPVVEEAYWNAVADGDLALRVFARAEGRTAYGEGRPKGTGVSSEEALEVLEAAREYVRDLDPAERNADRTVFPERPVTSKGKPRKRGPSREGAARIRASSDLGISRETLRRTLKSPRPEKLS